VKPQRRYIPRVRFQYKIWWFVTSRGFEYGIFILIIINTLTLAMKVGIHSRRALCLCLSVCFSNAARCYRERSVVASRGFEYGIFILIIINTLTLAMKVGIHSVSLVLLIVTP